MEMVNQEMEYSQIMSKDKLEFLDILKAALNVPAKNVTFIIFSSLTSFPFFCFLFFYEIVLQQTFHEALNISPRGSYSYWSVDVDDWPQLYFPKLIKLLLLYLVPYHLLEFLSITTVVDLASKLHGGEAPSYVRDMIQEFFKKTRVKGPLITSTYVLLLSTSSLLGLTWVVANYFILSRGFNSYYYYYYDYSMADHLVSFLNLVLHGVAFSGLLLKCMEWSGGWNMSLVISVLEESSYGSEAFEASAYFSRGSKFRGAQLMLVFFAWGCLLRLPCVLGGCYKGMGGIMVTFLYAILITVGNVMKWVVCVVYYFDCKRRVLKKKVDEEIGTLSKRS